MENLSKPSPFKLILLTLVFVLLAHYIVVFTHEYSHAFTAWLLGYKTSPFDLNYGGTSLSNLLLLSNVDQNVNNSQIYSLGHPGYVGLIAFAGPGIIVLLYFISFWLIRNNKIISHPYFLYFLFFFNLWCLCGTYAYVPVRTFTPSGYLIDILDVEQSLNISPWWIYFIVGYLVIFMMWLFFSKTLISIYANVPITSTVGRASLMILTVLIIFGYGALAGYFNQGDISHFISVTSIFAVPLIIVALWPTRKWVKEQSKKFTGRS